MVVEVVVEVQMVVEVVVEVQLMVVEEEVRLEEKPVVKLVVVEELVARYKHPMSIVFLLSYFPLDQNMMKARSRNKLVFL